MVEQTAESDIRLEKNEKSEPKYYFCVSIFVKVPKENIYSILGLIMRALFKKALLHFEIIFVA